MPKILQPCKNCGDQKVLKNVTLSQNGIKGEISLCADCLILVVLNNIQEMLQAIGVMITGISNKVNPEPLPGPVPQDEKGPAPGEGEQVKKQ